MSYEIMHNVLVEGILQNKAAGMSRVIIGGNDVMVSDKYVHPMPTKTYEDGLNEAWETARRIGKLWGDGGLSTDELREIFGITMTSSVFRENTAAEAAAKIAAWEDGKRIHVGDVVDVGEKGADAYAGAAVVTGRDGDRYFLLFNDGETGAFKEKHLTKTGRTVDIKAVLEAIGGGE